MGKVVYEFYGDAVGVYVFALTSMGIAASPKKGAVASCVNTEIRSYRCVEGFLKLADSLHDFVEVRNFAEEHGAEHGLVIGAPVGKVVSWRGKSEGAGLVRRVVHPRVAEENFPVLGDTLEESGIRQCPLTNAGTEQAPKIVVMSGHTELSRLVVRAEGFLMKQAGFFPEGAFGGEDTNREWTLRHELREALGEIRLNGAFRVWPVVGARAEFDFDHGLDVACLIFKCRWIVKEDTLSVWHVGIDFKLTSRVVAERSGDTGSESGLRP